MANYDFTYDFKHTLTGKTRVLDKKDQTITLALSSQAATSGQRSSTFVVQLQARVPGPSDGYWTVKTASFPRNGSKVVRWDNMPAGQYRLRFEKSTDDIRVTGVGLISNDQ